MYKALLVDDEPYVIEGLKTMGEWEKHGFTICGAASNGEDALEMLKACGPDLVFTDIRMPAMDGLQFIRQAREATGSRAKFVVLSGFDDFSYVQYAMRYDVSEYLLKPIDDEELNAIIAAIGRRIAEENREREESDRQLALIAAGAIKRILGGDATESLRKRLKSLLQIGAEEKLCCILMKIDHEAAGLDEREDGQIRRTKEAIKAFVGASLPHPFRFRLVEAAADRLLLIVSEDMELYHPAYCQPFFAEMREALVRQCCCGVSVAVSEAMVGLESVEPMYRQALGAIDYRFLQGEGSVIHYSEIKHIPLNHDFGNPALAPLLEEIQRNDHHGIATQIAQLFQSFSRQRRALEVIKAFIKNLELELIKRSLDETGDASAVSARFIEFNARMDHLTIEKLQTDLLEFCIALAERFSGNDNGGTQDIIHGIKRYIRENYSKEINLQRLAKEFYINPAYLGQLFKKRAGMQFSEYLHQTRIDEAKRLLRRTDLKIAEIAQSVGYRDPDYFVSKFKTIVGVSPSEFKKQ